MAPRRPPIHATIENGIVLKDFEGGNASLAPPHDIRLAVQRASIAALPEIWMKAYNLMNTSENEKVVLEAMKFLSSLATGDLKAKHIDGIAKTISNEELLARIGDAGVQSERSD